MREYAIRLENLNSQQLKDLYHFLVIEKKEKMYAITQQALSEGENSLGYLYYYDNKEGWLRGCSNNEPISLEKFYEKFKSKRNKID